MNKVLRALNLEKHYRGRAVVHGVSFEVAQGEIVGLLGPNGAGKTTSFYTVVGLIRPDAGTVLLDDVDLTHAPMYQRAQAGIGYLAQEPSVFRKMTVEDNVLAILEFQPGTPEQHRIRCAELLEEFGLTSLRKTRVAESVGVARSACGEGVGIGLTGSGWPQMGRWFGA